MVVAHNIGDGTVIKSNNGRLPYFGYRQFDKRFRNLYVKKIEAIFGKINYYKNYINHSTRPYCPAVISSLFFKLYNLKTKDYLSKSARIPSEIFKKEQDHLLAILIAFIIDEGNIDSTCIVINLKNQELTKDLLKICTKLGYTATLTFRDPELVASILQE